MKTDTKKSRVSFDMDMFTMLVGCLAMMFFGYIMATDTHLLGTIWVMMGGVLSVFIIAMGMKVD